MKVVRHIPTGRLVYRESPDFNEGLGISNAMAENPDLIESELEEVEVTQAQWDAELLLRMEEELPKSEHIGILTAVNPSLAKPATITRRHRGHDFTVNCLVTQIVKDQFAVGDIQLGDYVIVSFIEEIPNTEEREIAIVVGKVFESW